MHGIDRHVERLMMDIAIRAIDLIGGLSLLCVSLEHSHNVPARHATTTVPVLLGFEHSPNAKYRMTPSGQCLWVLHDREG